MDDLAPRGTHTCMPEPGLLLTKGTSKEDA